MNKPEKYKRFNPPATAGTCSRCKQTKGSDEFHRNPQNGNGLQCACKACLRASYLANAAQRIDAVRQRRWLDTRVRLASDARCRDRKAGRVSDIEADDIKIPEACPVTGRPLWHSKDAALSWSPHLERLDKSKGYVKGNWRVVSWGTHKLSGAALGAYEGPEDPEVPCRTSR